MRILPCVLVAMCVAFGAGSAPVHGAEVALVPVSASGAHVFAGQEIQLDGGGQTVVLEIRISNWDPDQDGLPILRAFQLTIDSSTYASGYQGVLTPTLTPCAGFPDPDQVCRVEGQRA